MTIPGVDAIVGMAIVAAVGDFHRIPDPDRLVADVGLNPKVRESGDSAPVHGQITAGPRCAACWDEPSDPEQTHDHRVICTPTPKHNLDNFIRGVEDLADLRRDRPGDDCAQRNCLDRLDSRGNNKINVAKIAFTPEALPVLVDKVVLNASSDASPAQASGGRLFLAWRGSGNTQLNAA